MWVQLALKLFADDGHFRRRFDPQPDTAARDPYDGDGHLVPDQDPFADLATQYKHDLMESVSRRVGATDHHQARSPASLTGTTK